MTVSNRTALYRFTFPATDKPAKAPFSNSSSLRNSSSAAWPLPYSPLILVDLKDLPGSRSNASITVDPGTGRIVGNGTFRPSFGMGRYDLHFCADFRGAPIRDTGIFMNNRAASQPKSVRTYDDGVDTGPPVPAGVWIQFRPPPDNQLLVRVGMSFMGVEQACANAEREIPAFDFDGTLSVAEAAWRKKLAVIRVDGTGINGSLSTVFWSGVYRAMISPQDYTGER